MPRSGTLDPTHWKHPQHGQTVDGYAGVRPTYKSDADIKAVDPGAFGSVEPLDDA